MTSQHDIAIIGSGFAGSLLAMIARRLGRSVVLIEKGKHPRVVIGESSTPLSNLLLEELSTRFDLPQVAPFAKYGTWRQTYPQIACGLKRGFTFFHHDLAKPSLHAQRRDRQLLVAASPNDNIADTHWYRADLDAALVKQACDLGVDYFDEVHLASARESSADIQLSGARKGTSFSVRANFVVDATGPRGFLHRAFHVEEVPLPDYPETHALYSHFTGVGRFEEQTTKGLEGTPPYPIDDAAVHHLFEGGWIWVLQFQNGVTSAGVAATRSASAKLRLHEGPTAWERLLDQIPQLHRQFAKARATQPFTFVPKLSFRSGTIARNRWALLPSAAGFVDPLLSTGFALTLLGVARLSAILEKYWESAGLSTQLTRYAEQTDAELLAAARLIAALYSNLHDFPTFVSLSLLYFAAASYSETVKRLGKPHLAPSFLLHDHRAFGPGARHLLERAMRHQTAAQAGELHARIQEVIEPFDVAGLHKRQPNNWYPVDPADLFAAAHKLGATREEIERLLEKCGLTVPALV